MAKVYRDILPEQLSLISPHSLRVKAAVLLNKAGKDGTYIKLRLNWLNNCVKVYLQNTEVTMIQHSTVLAPAHCRMIEVII